MPQFVPGLDLNRHYFQQVVKPLLDEHFPGLIYAAGLVGEGSDVLGYDTPQSMDHNWGPRLSMFLGDEDFKDKMEAIDNMLREELPLEFMGFSTNFTSPDLTSYLVQQMKPVNAHPVNHFIQFYTISSFFERFLGTDPYKKPAMEDWLSFPQQGLIEVTAGEVFYDEIGLQDVRQKFAYYPEDIWEYLYMVQWERFNDEQGFMGRSGERGDELGSSLVAGHLVQLIMRLCFYMEKQYFPYVKWIGTSFSKLRCAAELTGPLIDVLHAKDWQQREGMFEKVYDVLVRMHNELHLTKPIKLSVTDYHGRPYKVLPADEVYAEIRKSLKNEKLLELKYPIGSLDQFISHTHINHINKAFLEFKPILAKMEKITDGSPRNPKRYTP